MADENGGTPEPEQQPNTDTPDDNWGRLGDLIDEKVNGALDRWASKNNSSQTSGSPAKTKTEPEKESPKKSFLEKLITG